MEWKCCICGKNFVSYGNNAEPIKKGVCCDSCNARYIIASRILGVANASYEIVKTHKEKEAMLEKLAAKNFELKRYLPYNELYHNIETEENVILCIL